MSLLFEFLIVFKQLLILFINLPHWVLFDLKFIFLIKKLEKYDSIQKWNNSHYRLIFVHKYSILIELLFKF